MRLVKFWINECTTKHAACNSVRTGFVPSRLVYISKREPHPSVLMYHTTPADRNIRYLTLSHRWGNTQNITKLTSKYITAFQQNISYETLPRTFRDAIKIAIAVDVRYIWIDSLCIIQDSKDDWIRESATMGFIYGNSVCTIAAAAATDAEGGCFVKRDPLKYLDCKIAGDLNEDVYAVPFQRDAFGVVSSSSLVTRAWILQERIFSPCIVHFGDPVVFWTCLQGQASELNVGDYRGVVPPLHKPSVGFLEQKPFRSPIYSRSLFDSIMTTNYDLSDIKAALSFNRLWFRLISEYSKCNLTMAGDKLIAMSSIAQRIQQKTKFEYLAGL